jgi:hypothetical protein
LIESLLRRILVGGRRKSLDYHWLIPQGGAQLSIVNLFLSAMNRTALANLYLESSETRLVCVVLKPLFGDDKASLYSDVLHCASKLMQQTKNNALQKAHITPLSVVRFNP